MSSLYRNILKKAWQVTRKHFYLWPLGFFVAFLGNGGEYQVLTKQVKNVRLQPETVTNLNSWLTSLSPGDGLTSGNSFLLVIFFIVALLIILGLAWLIISSLAGLIKGSVLAAKDERNSFGRLLISGSKSFKPVLGLYVIAKIIVYGILAFILTPLMVATFAQGNQALNIFITILIFLIFIPLVIIVSFITRYASAYVVLKGQKMWEAFKNGWRLFVANWLISLEMAFILLIINLVVGLLIFFVAFLIFSPFFFVGITSTLQDPNAFGNIILIPIVLIILITIVAGSMLATFQVGSWTLLFVRLTQGGKAYSKIIRWVATLPKKIKSEKI